MSKILNSKEIGWKVRTMRLRAGFTQERLAEALGITSQQIQKYESGANKLNTDRLQELAEIFNTPIQSFFELSDDTLPLETTEKHLLESFRAIDNKEIKECLAKIVSHVNKVKE